VCLIEFVGQNFDDKNFEQKNIQGKVYILWQILLDNILENGVFDRVCGSKFRW
jgi:hypothetical protein